MPQTKKSKSLSKRVESKVSARRAYDNSSRAEKSDRTRRLILETLVQLLVERQGAEVPIQELAQKSGITERTIFRFFKDKKTLHQALDNYLLEYLEASSQQMKTLDFLGFAQNVFHIFDRNEPLVKAYLFSPIGHEARGRFRKKLTQAMVQKISQERRLTLTPERMKKLALITSLVNAKIWYDVREDFGFSGAEMSSTVAWALQLLLKNC